MRERHVKGWSVWGWDADVKALVRKSRRYYAYQAAVDARELLRAGGDDKADIRSDGGYERRSLDLLSVEG